MPPRAAPSDASAVAAVDEASRYFTDGEREWYDSDRIHACETHLLERCATCGEDHGAHNEYWRRAQRERYMRAKTTRVATKRRETAQSGGGGGVSNVRRRARTPFST